MSGRRSDLKKVAWFQVLRTSFIIFLFIVSKASSAACTKEVVVGWEVWKPFQYQDASQEYTGLDFDLFRAVMASAGCDVKFVEMPWKRIMAQMQIGEIDAVIGASKTDKRKNFGYFSKPFRYEKMVMFVRKGETEKYPQRSFKALFASQFSLGATLGYAYGDEYERALRDNPEYTKKLNLVKADVQNYDMLLFGRIDGFLGELHHVSYDLKRKGAYHLVEVHPIDVLSDDIYVMFSKKNVQPEFVYKFNTALGEVRSSGEYDKVVYQYFQ